LLPLVQALSPLCELGGFRAAFFRRPLNRSPRLPLAYTRPLLYPKQERAFFNPHRYSFIEASTKAGKTVAAIAWIVETALEGERGQNFWWVAPIVEQSKIAFNRIRQGLTVGTFTAREAPTPTITLVNGAIITFKSGDNPDSLYGEDVYAAIVDEASRVKEKSWEALRSTLTATEGPIRIIGNVQGRKNWFYRLARLAQSGRRANMYYEKITILDAVAAGVLTKDALEDAKAVYSERTFNELYMAEASDDGGNPFGLQHIRECVFNDSTEIDSRTGLAPGPAVAFGVDLAKKQDYLVVIGLNSTGQVCSFDRWQGISWRQSIRRIHALVGEDAPALVDSTGVGDPVLEELQESHGNFRGYNFTQASKQRLMEGLAVSIQGHELAFPAGPIVDELESFEYELTRTGVRYQAPEGLHDDCVCSLALARQAWAEGAPAASLLEFWADRAAREKLRREARPGLVIDAEFEPAEAAADPDEGFELTELYDSTIRRFTAGPPVCAGCSQPLGAARVSDGVRIWHSHCFDPRVAA
jgi:hypothetical protein